MGTLRSYQYGNGVEIIFSTRVNSVKVGWLSGISFTRGGGGYGLSYFQRFVFLFA